MRPKGRAKLYYLYLMADGKVSEEEKTIFDRICNDLSINVGDKTSIINDCIRIKNEKRMTCMDVLEMNICDSSVNELLDLDIDKSVNDKDKASILWNLINLGYADTSYSIAEREIVDYIRDYWDISDSLYQEMISVAETFLAIEKYKEWIEQLPDNEYKLEKRKQIRKDATFAKNAILTTISEISF